MRGSVLPNKFPFVSFRYRWGVTEKRTNHYSVGKYEMGLRCSLHLHRPAPTVKNPEKNPNGNLKLGLRIVSTEMSRTVGESWNWIPFNHNHSTVMSTPRSNGGPQCNASLLDKIETNSMNWYLNFVEDVVHYVLALNSIQIAGSKLTNCGVTM